MDFQAIMKEAAVVLPHQAILENFVHHNPFESLQYMSFHEAHDWMRKATARLSPGERLLRVLGSDPRGRQNAAVVGIAAVFLDRGVSKWQAPHRERGFLYFFATLEGLGFTPWRKYARIQARGILWKLRMMFDHQKKKQLNADTLKQAQEEERLLAEAILQDNLRHFGATPADWMETLRALLMDLPGWAGMFQRMENHPHEAPEGSYVRLYDFAAVLSIFARSSIEALATEAKMWHKDCNHYVPLSDILNYSPTHRSFEEQYLQNPSGLAHIDQNADMREGLEIEVERRLLSIVSANSSLDTGVAAPDASGRPAVQFFTCIDERECSFREHLERGSAFGAGMIQTFGIAGFFNLPIVYKAFDGRHDETLAPEGTVTGHILHEVEHACDHDGCVRYHKRTRLFQNFEQWWEMCSFCPLRSLLLALMFPFTLFRLAMICCFPTSYRRLKQRIVDTFIGTPKTSIKPAFSANESAARLAAVFRNIGLKDNFAPVVVVLGHGSRTVNNPFDAAHNCGACGGREGGPNARLFSQCANDPSVRTVLLSEYGICIPEDTWFVSGYHDTSSELVDLFDAEEKDVPANLREHWVKVMEVIYEARGKNALERCGKFMLATNVHSSNSTEAALEHVHTRSTDLGEARPELGHATNAAIVVGRRELTRGTFLSRRVFLPSYDPFNDDDQGTNLETAMTPALVVGSGINLEYFFSTVDGGAGTKICMNIVGDLGVMQGCNSDLLIGLPTQMTEMHSPVRGLYLIDAPVDRVEAVFKRRENLRCLVHNEWVRWFVRDPYTHKFYQWSLSAGGYVEVQPEECQEIPVSPSVALTQKRCVGLTVVQEESNKIDVMNWTAENFVPFTHHLTYALTLASYEQCVYYLTSVAMILSCAYPIYSTGASQMMHPRGKEVAVGATVLTLLNVTFARRYVHGEFMYTRFMSLAAVMLASFIVVATAPNLQVCALGWTVLAFATTFLIGAYNDRPTARENATFVFFLYQLSDSGLLVAVSLYVLNRSEHWGVATGLLLSAFTKASQFPGTNLFARSMESASPSSALADAALSAHAGVVLLTGTMPLWFHHTWARQVLAGVGAATVLAGGCVSKVRADRKGSLGNAIAATIGMIFIIIAAGYADLALVLAFGHAALRMWQILRSHNLILDHHQLKAAMGQDIMTKGRQISEPLFRLAWMLNRTSADLHLPFIGHFFRHQYKSHKMHLSKYQQWAMTALAVMLAGFPFTPMGYYRDLLVQFLVEKEVWVGVGMALVVSVALSTTIIWFTLANILDPSRFHPKSAPNDKEGDGLLNSDGQLSPIARRAGA